MKNKTRPQRANTSKAVHSRAKNATEWDYPVQLRRYRMQLVNKALAYCKGNKSKAAVLLKITRPYLYRVLSGF